MSSQIVGVEPASLDAQFRQDPHAVFDILRRDSPVFREPLGAFLLTRYDDVRAILTDLSLWRDPEKAEASAKQAQDLKANFGPDRGAMLLMDDPDHSRVRKPIAQALYKRVSAARAPIAEIVRQRLDRLAGRDEFDLVQEFSIPVPMDSIAYILGVDAQDMDDFRAWSEAALFAFYPNRSPFETARMVRGLEAVNTYMARTMAARRAVPQEDLISDLVHLQAEGAPISDHEIQVNCVGLLTAGNLTTTDAISSATWLLLGNPEELAKLKKDPGLFNVAIEEALRVEPPIAFGSRFASNDMILHGCPVRRSQAFTVSLQAANRDPTVFEDPHRFNITRERAPNVSFGGGAHFCIGHPLARLELQLALSSLFARYPRLHLSEPDRPPERQGMPVFNGIKRLLVRV